MEIVNRLDDPSRLYMGTAAGLYEGFNDGQTWQKISGYSWDSQPVDGLLADGSNGVWLNSPDGAFYLYFGYALSLIHILRRRRALSCRSLRSPYH